MNQPKGFNLRRVIIIAAVVLAIGIALLFWARDVIREVVVLPLSYLFWVISLFIRSTPQLFFWISALVIAFLIAYRGLAGRRKVLLEMPLAGGISEVPDHHLVTGRVIYWRGKVHLMNAGRGSYFQNSFHLSITRLLLDQLAHRYRLPVDEVEPRLKDGSLNVPEEVRSYVLSSLSRPENASRGFFASLWRSLMDRIRVWMSGWTKTPKESQVDPRFARILQYMEEELEVSHDHPGQ